MEAKIVLFDYTSRGHHLKYAELMIRYLLERSPIDCDIVMITVYRDSAYADMVQKYNERVTYCYLEKNATDFNFNASSLSSVKYRVHYVGILSKLISESRKMKADIIHILSIDRLELPLFIATTSLFYTANCTAECIFTTLHGYHFWSTKRMWKKNILRNSLTRIERAVFAYMLNQNIIQGVFVHTEGVHKALRRSLNLTSNASDRIRTIPYPVEYSDEFKIEMSKAREYLSLTPHEPILLLFGPLRRSKGLKLLFQALRGVSTPLVLLIAGKPKDYKSEDVQQWASDLESNSAVKVTLRLHYIPESEVPLYFRAASFVLLPYSRDFRGQSGPLLLSAAARRPVIGTNIGEIGPIIRHYNAGITAEPTARTLQLAILQMLSINIHTRNSFIEGLDSLIAHNTDDKSGRAVSEAYQECLSNLIEE